MNAFIDTIFQAASPLLGWLSNWLVACLVSGTVLALATWIVVKLVGKRMPASLVFLLWLIVLIKFLAPTGPGWSYSLASLTSAAHPRWAPAPTPAPAQAANSDGDITHFVPLEAGAAVANEMPSNNADSHAWPKWLLPAYLAGVAIFGVRHLLAHARLKRGIDALPAATSDLVRLVEDVCDRHHIANTPRVKISLMAPAPFILGFLRPTLVLSPRQLASRAELEAVVLHEIAHLRRADWLARCLQQLVGTLLFFWPVVAWVNRRIDLAREQSCDEWALRHGRLSAGQYARCLLRAVQPVSAAARAACPTAMAANARHVERRIEMILQKNPAGRPSRMVGLLAGSAVLGWAGFVLAGPQQEKKVVVQCDDSTAGKKVVVINGDDNGDGAEEHMIFLTGDGPCVVGGEGEDTVYFHTEDGTGDTSRAMIAVRGPGGKSLVKFGKDHPTADANGDGQISQSEYNAYITALALSDPAKVIAQYPDADRNSDGKLNASEAARLVVAPPKMPTIGKVMAGDAKGTWVAGEPAPAGNVEVNVTATGDSPDKRVMVIRKTDANGNTTEETVQGEAGVPILSKVPLIGHMFSHELPMPASAWLLKNLTGTPAAGDVSKLVPVVESTDLAIFLEMNPKADRNGDGILTSAERDAFVTENMSVMRQKFLDKNPAADTNGDGVLTQEEMHTFMKSSGPAMGAGLHGKMSANVTVKDGKVYVDGKEVSADDNNVKVIRVQPNANGGEK